MLTLKLRDMVDMKDALKRIIQIKMPIQTSFKLSRITRLINDELVTLGQSIDQVVAEESEIVDGKKVVPKDKLPQVNARIDSLLDLEVKIEGEQIKVAELGQIDVASEDLMLCDKLIVE